MPDESNLPEESWVNDLHDFLLNQEGVEAIRVNPQSKSISIATFGKKDLSNLESSLDEVLKGIEKHLREGAGDQTQIPFDGTFVSSQKDETVIGKSQCPAVHGLWVWNDVEWPSDEGHEHSTEEWKTMSWLAGVCGVALLSAFILDHFGAFPAWLIFGLYGISIISGGWDAAVDAWEGIKSFRFDIHFLMLAVALGAVSIGSYAEGALLLFLFSFSGALEHFTEYRTHREISSLTKAAPKTANLLQQDGSVSEVNVSNIKIQDVILVKPDELFPVDGEIVSGKTAVDESNLTGEANPVDKITGETVYSGTLNLWGSVQVTVTRQASESALQRIIRLIQDSQHLKAPSQRFTDKFGTTYTYLILGLTLAYFLVLSFVMNIPAFDQGELGYSAFYRAMTFLVVASPCALVLSIPSAILASIAWGARHGILFRGGAAIEKLAEVDVVAMDKTGTLTKGDLNVKEVESFPDGREGEVLQWAFSLESHSNHPIARAIVSHGKKEGLKAVDIGEFKSYSGKGVQGELENETIFLGRRELMAEGPLAEWIDQVEEPPPSITEVWVFHKDLIGRILLEDTIRENSKSTIEQIKAQNILTLMLTGDRRGAAEAVGEATGVDEIHCKLMPEDKVTIISDLTKQGKKVAMVGDGVNDAPSLAAAYVSVAMGARGSDAALEQSEVVLMNDKIERFLTALNLSHKAKRIIKQNLVISLGTVCVMAAFALSGSIPLTIGVFAHEGSTVLVCLNSLRLLFTKE